MSFFQQSVLNKYLQAIDEGKVNEAWEKFTTYFHDPERQENIRNIKEEEYGIDFLIKFFVNILGYTKNPDPNFNLKAEQKNLTDPKKADGAILQNEKVIGVIELKGMDTTDLAKVETQAFGYKNKQPDAIYIITSNFEKLRFYIDNAVDFEEFNLFKLTQERFKVLWLCLAKENVFNHIPKKVKDESLEEEELITKKLYKDYSTFKHEIFNNIVELNPLYNKLLLFKKTQKLLDRFLFILFAEDKGLLPPNSINRVIKKFTKLIELDAYKSLYDIFKQYFGYMNIGRKGKTTKDDIEPYNGGLFKNDNVLDNIIIDDELLKHHLEIMYNYDFKSEVSVNILGHIFEHSLNEIEEITAELEGKEIDKSKTKRKKDGVYYTPKYITKYIVDNTVSKLCEEKKVELGIIDKEYEKERKWRHTKTLEKLIGKLEQYRKWLLELTICDPACGSGAFLIQVLDFLISEHRYIDELNRILLGHTIEFPNVEISILENNIYGVDINEEAVEIAKLSLWLRTAKKGRKLTTLSNNIKCGNSLIDDKNIAGEKAFNWKIEFAEILKKGGFGVVIGNPPYGADLSEIHKSYLEKAYKTFEYQVNTYVLFYERGINITKNNGMLGFITPATFTYQHYFKKLRKHLQDYRQIAISKYFYEVFEDSDIGDSVSWILKKTENKKSDILIQICKTQVHSSLTPLLTPYNIIVNDDTTYNLTGVGIKLSKLYNNAKDLIKVARITVGIKAYQKGKGKPQQTREIVNEKIFTSNYQKENTYKQCVVGKDFHKYKFIQEPKMYLSYGDWLAEPRISAPFFDDEKIILRQTSDSIIGHIDIGKRINLNNVYNIGYKKDSNIYLKYILSLLNSRLMNYVYQNISQERNRTFAEVKKVYLSKLPIKIISKKLQAPFIDKSDRMIELNDNQQIFKSGFLNRLTDNFNIDKISKKLEKFYLYDFSILINELKQQKITFKLREQDEWSSYFEENKEKINLLQLEIDKTDREIDLMVYKLYGLTEKEIMIIEAGI